MEWTGRQPKLQRLRAVHAAIAGAAARVILGTNLHIRIFMFYIVAVGVSAPQVRVQNQRQVYQMTSVSLGRQTPMTAIYVVPFLSFFAGWTSPARAEGRRSITLSSANGQSLTIGTVDFVKNSDGSFAKDRAPTGSPASKSVEPLAKGTSK
jgi:hypothetical protein